MLLHPRKGAKPMRDFYVLRSINYTHSDIDGVRVVDVLGGLDVWYVMESGCSGECDYTVSKHDTKEEAVAACKLLIAEYDEELRVRDAERLLGV